MGALQLGAGWAEPGVLWQPSWERRCWKGSRGIWEIVQGQGEPRAGCPRTSCVLQGRGTLELSQGRVTLDGWRKFCSPERSQSLILGMSHPLRCSDLLQLCCFAVGLVSAPDLSEPKLLLGSMDTLSLPFPQPALDSWLLAWLCPESQPPQPTGRKKRTESSLTFHCTFLFALIPQNNIPSEPSLS